MKMKTNNKTFPIVGMHCASCAKLIERKLARTPGVTEAQVNYGSETAMINCDDSVSDKDLEDAVGEAGYKAVFTSSASGAQSEGKTADEIKEEEKKKELRELK